MTVDDIAFLIKLHHSLTKYYCQLSLCKHWQLNKSSDLIVRWFYEVFMLCDIKYDIITDLHFARYEQHNSLLSVQFILSKQLNCKDQVLGSSYYVVSPFILALHWWKGYKPKLLAVIWVGLPHRLGGYRHTKDRLLLNCVQTKPSAPVYGPLTPITQDAQTAPTATGSRG